MQAQLLALLAGRRGHFQMESGYHSTRWFELDRLFARPEALSPFVAELARRLDAHRPQVVCGPMTGGARLAAAVGTLLGLPSFPVERIEPGEATGLFPVRYQLAPAHREGVRGRRVAIVDDAISAGSAVRGTHADLLTCGAQPVALGALIVFGEAAARYAEHQTLPLEWIAHTAFDLWLPEACPLCRAGVPVERVAEAPSPPTTNRAG